MELPDGFPDASVPVAAAFLPDLHPTVAIPQALRAWDASVAVRPDEVPAVTLALAAVPYAERLAAPEPVVPAPVVVVLQGSPEEPCTPGAGRFAA